MPDTDDLPISDRYIRTRESREEKRARVLAEGTPVEYVTCPLCGLNRVLDKHAKGRVRWDTVDPETALILQVRCGGGWGSGFYLDEERSMTFEKMVRVPEHRAMVVAIRDQAARITRAADRVLGSR
jgi:hypothetical protein